MESEKSLEIQGYKRQIQRTSRSSLCHVTYSTKTIVCICLNHLANGEIPATQMQGGKRQIKYNYGSSFCQYMGLTKDIVYICLLYPVDWKIPRNTGRIIIKCNVFLVSEKSLEIHGNGKENTVSL